MPWYQRGKENNGTGRVKDSGGWEGRVEEGVWGEQPTGKA